ncbi:MAG: 2-dehydropantoate 2-reductase, partial [Methanobacteriota archaeon]
MSRTKKNTQNNKYPRLGLVGLGPVGLILATHFKEAGCEIAICDHDKVKMNLIQREGVRLEGTIEKHVFFEHVYSSLGEMNEWKPEIIFFAVKTHHMPHVLEEATFLKKDDVLVVSAQNGIDAEQFLADAFGENRTIRMVINFAGNLNAPNVVKVTFFNPPNYIASIDDTQSEVARQLAEILNTVSLDTKPTDSFDILKRVWIKTILNSALSALCGIGKLTIKEAMEIPDTVEIVEQIILEAVEVAEAEKIKFEDDFVRKCLRYLRKAGPHFPSLAVDLINNRPTEIDFFNGKIVEYGRKHYIRTPLNLAFTNMVKAITHRNLMTLMPGLSSGTSRMPRRSGATTTRPRRRASQKDRHFLGIDLGSAYTKLTVIDEDENVVFQTVLKTINRDKVALKHVLETIHQDFPIQFSCATGYGRKHFPDADIIKTE